MVGLGILYIDEIMNELYELKIPTAAAAVKESCGTLERHMTNYDSLHSGKNHFIFNIHAVYLEHP